MKKINNYSLGMAIAMCIISIMQACKHGPSTSIKSSDGRNHQKTEYSGRVVFNKDNNGVDYISAGGHLFFERNDEKFEAHPDKSGHIKYSFNGDDEVDTLSENQKAFVKEAITVITKERSRLNASRN